MTDRQTTSTAERPSWALAQDAVGRALSRLTPTQRAHALNVMAGRAPVGIAPRAMATASAPKRRPTTPTSKPVTPTRKPAVPTRPKVLSTRAERAQVLDTRPDISAALRAEFDKPELSAQHIREALKFIPCTGVMFGTRVMEPNEELDRRMGINTNPPPPVKRTAAGIQIGTMTREQAREVLARHNGGSK